MTHTTKDDQEIPTLSHPIEAPCVVCGSNGRDIVCSAHDVNVHYRYLRRFHTRRLHLDRADRVTASALEDRIRFTQDYATILWRAPPADCSFETHGPRRQP